MPEVKRPWGFYEVIETRTGYQIKHLVVHPGMRLSLQSHEFRSEHWYILSGSGIVTIDSNMIEVRSGDSVTIPVRAKHRVSADMGSSLEFIEVQTGLSFDEADIVRYEDDFGRAGS
jgi:mannose-6-phosphate isomerase-like protein (cupin superfamily)